MGVVLGIPEEIFRKILWVSDEHRTNSLSLQAGGVSLVVVFASGGVHGYDKVKMPSRYIPEVVTTNGVINIFCIETVFVKAQGMFSYVKAWSKSENNETQLIDTLQYYDAPEYGAVNQRYQSHSDDSSEKWSFREIANLYGYDPSYGQSEEDFLDSQMPDRD